MSSTPRNNKVVVGLPGFPGIPGNPGTSMSLGVIGNAQISAPFPGNRETAWFFTSKTNPPVGPYPQAQAKTQILSGLYELVVSAPIVGGGDTSTIYFPNYGPPPAVEGELATYVAQLGATPRVKLLNSGDYGSRTVYMTNITATIYTSYIVVVGFGIDPPEVVDSGESTILYTGTSSINFIVTYE